MPITLFAFDWSGTLSDDRPPVYQANMRMRDAYGLEQISYEDWMRTSVGNVVELFQIANPSLSAEQIWSDYRRIFDEVLADGIEPSMYEAVPALMQALRDANKIVGIVSAHPQKNLEAEAERYGLREHFDFIIGDCRAKDAALREMAQLYVDNPNTQALYTGDTIQDMHYAKLAGYKTAAIGTGYQSEAQLRAVSPDFYIDTHADFYPLINS